MYYEPLRVLGRGSFGVVLLAKRGSVLGGAATEDAEYCVIKQVDLRGVSEKQREVALAEAEVLQSLSHPNIIGWFNAFFEDAMLCIAMEYADAGDLADAVARRRDAMHRFHERDAMAIFVQLALAVQYLHDRRVLHRDLKSQNVFLMTTGVVKLGDFGIAKVLKNSLCCAETCIGTPHYLPPEICENQPYNFKADIWCLGVVLYEVLALEVPFSAQSIAALAMKIITANPRPLPAVYSSGARALPMKMMVKRAKDRPSINKILTSAHVRRSIASLPTSGCFSGISPMRGNECSQHSPNTWNSPASQHRQQKDPAFSLASAVPDISGHALDDTPTRGAPAQMMTTPGTGASMTPGTGASDKSRMRCEWSVDLAEAEHLLDETPSKRLREAFETTLRPWISPGSPPRAASLTRGASASMNLDELDSILRRKSDDELCPDSDNKSLGAAAFPSSRRRFVESVVSCSKMLRNLEHDFGLV